MSDFIDFISDQLGNPPYLSVRKMFGEHCLFYHGKIIAIIGKDDRIYMKANAETLPRFQAAGSEQFEYQTKNGISKMNYWTLPETAVEDGDELKEWLALGIQAAG